MDDLFNTEKVNRSANWEEDTSQIPLDKLRQAQEGIQNSYGFVVPTEVTSYDGGGNAPPPKKPSNNTVTIVVICVALIVTLIVGAVVAGIYFKNSDSETTTSTTKVIHKPIDEARRYTDVVEEYQGHAYAIINYEDKNLKSYKDCVKYCKSVGGHMAIIESQEENDFLFDFVRRTGNRTAYFGYTDREVEGRWEWDGAAKKNYTNWAYGQPNNGAANDGGGPEDYAQFFHKEDSGKWNDALWNSNTRSFICEWE